MGGSYFIPQYWCSVRNCYRFWILSNDGHNLAIEEDVKGNAGVIFLTFGV